MIPTKKQKSVPQLIKTATRYFNAYIRKRDEGQPCICCGQYRTLQAGHFYSAGKYPALRFNEDNVHGQAMNCNYFLSGNLLEYRKNLIQKIGIERVEKLDQIAQISKRGYKVDRFTLESIIETYKRKNKEG